MESNGVAFNWNRKEKSRLIHIPAGDKTELQYTCETLQ